jgi:hypothetical protein
VAKGSHVQGLKVVRLRFWVPYIIASLAVALKTYVTP